MRRDLVSGIASFIGSFVISLALTTLSGCGSTAAEIEVQRQRAEIAEHQATVRLWVGVVAGAVLLVTGVAVGALAHDGPQEWAAHRAVSLLQGSAGSSTSRCLPWWRRFVRLLVWYPSWFVHRVSPSGALARWIRRVLAVVVTVVVPLVAVAAILPLIATVVTGVVDIATTIAKATVTLIGVGIACILCASWFRR